MNRSPVIIIGIDGADWTIIDPLLETGKLPTLARLKHEGVFGPLPSTIPPISSGSWTSIVTGVWPNKHAIVDFAVSSPSSYRTRPVTSTNVQAVPFWAIAGQELDGVGILNVPMTYPPRPFNGLLVSGFPTPEELGQFTHPPKFLTELREHLGDDFRFQPRVGSHDEQNFYDEMWTVTRFVKDATLHLLSTRQFGLFMTVLVGPDALGHTFWKYFDPTHPQHQQASKRFMATIPDIYEEVDRAIAEILRQLPDDTRVIIVSDHGFGATHYAVSINTWLADRGYLKFKSTIPTFTRHSLFKVALTPARVSPLLKTLGLPNKAQKVAYSPKSLVQTLRKLLLMTEEDIDWSQTVAYSQGNFGQIFINLKGRQPQGVVPVDQYDQVLDKLIRDLQELDHKSEQVFDLIYKMKDVYGDSRPYSIPDLVCMNSQAKYVVQRMFELGSNQYVIPNFMWSGTHHPTGIFLAYDGGRSIQQGMQVTGVEIVDIAPLVLYLLGLGVPDDMDGKVPENVITPRHLGNNPVRYCSTTKPPSQQLTALYDEQEESAVLKRLSDLGYL